MKYFQLFTEPSLTDGPILINWYQRLNPSKVSAKLVYQIPKRTTIQLMPNPHLQFSDVISAPYFLVSKLLHELIELYQPHTIYKKIILSDMENGHLEQYYLPVFEEVPCLSTKAELNLDRSVVNKLVLDPQKIGRNHIFKLAGVNNTHIIASLDFVESMLIRKAKGIALLEAELIDGGEPDDGSRDQSAWV